MRPARWTSTPSLGWGEEEEEGGGCLLLEEAEGEVGGECRPFLVLEGEGEVVVGEEHRPMGGVVVPGVRWMPEEEGEGVRVTKARVEGEVRVKKVEEEAGAHSKLEAVVEEAHWMMAEGELGF